MKNYTAFHIGYNVLVFCYLKPIIQLKKEAICRLQNCIIIEGTREHRKEIIIF